MFATFNRFELQMTKRQAEACSHSGSCDADVKILSEHTKIRRQIAKIEPDKIRAELKEYGAWDETELADDAQNVQRILWIACNIAEETK